MAGIWGIFEILKDDQSSQPIPNNGMRCAIKFNCGLVIQYVINSKYYNTNGSIRNFTFNYLVPLISTDYNIVLAGETHRDYAGGQAINKQNNYCSCTTINLYLGSVGGANPLDTLSILSIGFWK